VLGPGNAPILAVICPILTCFLGNCTVKHCNLPKSGRFLVDFYILVRKCILFKKWLVSIFILFLPRLRLFAASTFQKVYLPRLRLFAASTFYLLVGVYLPRLRLFAASTLKIK